MAEPFIPEALSRTTIDWVAGCSWCDYDSRARPWHHPACPRSLLQMSDSIAEKRAEGRGIAWVMLQDCESSRI